MHVSEDVINIAEVREPATENRSLRAIMGRNESSQKDAYHLNLTSIYLDFIYSIHLLVYEKDPFRILLPNKRIHIETSLSFA